MRITAIIVISAGADAAPSIAGAVDLSTYAALAPTSAAAAPTVETEAAKAANAARDAPVTSTAASSNSSNVGVYTAGTSGAMIQDCVKWIFTGQ